MCGSGDKLLGFSSFPFLSTVQSDVPGEPALVSAWQMVSKFCGVKPRDRPLSFIAATKKAHYFAMGVKPA
jgi:hypothetical protein